MGIGQNNNGPSIDLVDAYDQIIDAVVDLLKSEIEPGGKLEEINGVIRGDRARSKPKEPHLWVFAQDAVPSQDYGLKEKWTMPINIVAVVRDNDPEIGCKRATSFSAKARTIILKNSRTLGLGGIVTDVVSGNFSPAQPWSSRETLHGSGAVISIKFMTFEH